MSTAPKPTPESNDDAVRPHVFDGIQEYDKRMPNWWLLTFYGAIVFWLGYWFYFHHIRQGTADITALQSELTRIEAVKLASSSSQLDDASLWKMSRNAVFVDAGRATFNSTCASCHKENMHGSDEGAIGPNLVDKVWIHGGNPTDLIKVVDKGVLDKGMPPWGPVIGAKKTSEVVAYILSHHEEPK